MPSLNLQKNFIYYVQSDIQYNIDAFLLSTGFRIECCDAECNENRARCDKCQFTFLINCKSESDAATWDLVDLRKVVNPVDYICPFAVLSLVQLTVAEKLGKERERVIKEMSNQISEEGFDQENAINKVKVEQKSEEIDK